MLINVESFRYNHFFVLQVHLRMLVLAVLANMWICKICRLYVQNQIVLYSRCIIVGNNVGTLNNTAADELRNKTSVPVFYRRIKYSYEFGCV